MKAVLKLLVVSVALMALVIACGQKAESDSSAAAAAGDDFLPGTSANFTIGTTQASIAGIAFFPPTEWTDLGPSGMRQGNYYYGPIDNDADSAVMAVYYFGPSQGGTIEANLERWINQMKMPDGGDPHDEAKMTEMMAGDIKVHLLKVPGTYTAAGGMMSQGSMEKDGYLMVAAVVEAPEGNVFFKLTGPEKTATEMGAGLVQVLKAVHKL